MYNRKNDENTSGSLRNTVSSINSRVSSLETSFPAGCNIIMQAVTAKGQTPASNSPSDIASAINNISGGIDFDYISAFRYTTDGVTSGKDYMDGVTFGKGINGCVFLRNTSGSYRAANIVYEYENGVATGNRLYVCIGVRDDETSSTVKTGAYIMIQTQNYKRRNLLFVIYARDKTATLTYTYGQSLECIGLDTNKNIAFIANMDMYVTAKDNALTNAFYNVNASYGSGAGGSYNLIVVGVKIL